MNQVESTNTSLEVDIQLATEDEFIIDKEQLKQWATQAYIQALKDQSELNSNSTRECVIRVVDEQESENLNSKFRKKDYPTNVLSFCYEDIDDYLGDIVICHPVVLKEAKEQQKTATEHYAHMVTHGMLHLLGYDHIEDQDAKHMEQLETVILQNQGYPAPYFDDDITT